MPNKNKNQKQNTNFKHKKLGNIIYIILTIDDYLLYKRISNIYRNSFRLASFLYSRDEYMTLLNSYVCLDVMSISWYLYRISPNEILFFQYDHLLNKPRCCIVYYESKSRFQTSFFMWNWKKTKQYLINSKGLRYPRLLLMI